MADDIVDVTWPEVTAFAWVPPFARGQVRDLRVRWALEELDRPYRVRLLSGPERPKDYFREQPADRAAPCCRIAWEQAAVIGQGFSRPLALGNMQRDRAAFEQPQVTFAAGAFGHPRLAAKLLNAGGRQALHAQQAYRRFEQLVARGGRLGAEGAIRDHRPNIPTGRYGSSRIGGWLRSGARVIEESISY